MLGCLRNIALPAALVLLALSPAAAQMDDEARIKDLDQQWNQAVAMHDIDAIVNFYASDGRLMPPGAPMARGQDAIRDTWQNLLAIRNFSLSFQPVSINVAKSGEMAWEAGTYQLGFDSNKGPVQDKGKYVVVWTRAYGDWKAAADIFNSDGGM